MNVVELYKKRLLRRRREDFSDFKSRFKGNYNLLTKFAQITVKIDQTAAYYRPNSAIGRIFTVLCANLVNKL